MAIPPVDVPAPAPVCPRCKERMVEQILMAGPTVYLTASEVRELRGGYVCSNETCPEFADYPRNQDFQP